MPYALQRLAPGSYDLFLDSKLIGGVVRDMPGEHHPRGWQAELLGDVLRSQRPPPFTELSHHHPSFEAVLDWLGRPSVDEGEGNR